MSGEMNIHVDFPNKAEIKKKLALHEKAVGKAVRKTIYDFKKRAPGWIRASIGEQYGIKKSDIPKPSFGKNGTFKIAGVTIDNIRLKYSGGVLTPTHFKMRPTARPQKKYKVTAVIKGSTRKELSSIAFLARAKKAKTNESNAGTAPIQIPFQRTGDGRLPIMPIKTLSVPQMITNPKVADSIEERISDGLGKRMQHNLEQELSKI